MTELTKYKVRIRNNEFEIEIESTDKDFVEKKLKDYAMTSMEAAPKGSNSLTSNTNTTIRSITLVKLLKDNNATSNQIRKFLGAAVYLSLKGNSSIKTSDVTSALKDAGQTRLSNPSSCLADNIKKGFIERSGSEFMVTMHGKEEFGITDY